MVCWQRSVTYLFLFLPFLLSYYYFGFRFRVYLVCIDHFIGLLFYNRLEWCFVGGTGEGLVFGMELIWFFGWFFHFETAVGIEHDAIFLLIGRKWRWVRVLMWQFLASTKLIILFSWIEKRITLNKGLVNDFPLFPQGVVYMIRRRIGWRIRWSMLI